LEDAPNRTGACVAVASRSFVITTKRDTEGKEISKGAEPEAGTVREDVK